MCYSQCLASATIWATLNDLAAFWGSEVAGASDPLILHHAYQRLVSGESQGVAIQPALRWRAIDSSRQSL